MELFYILRTCLINTILFSYCLQLEAQDLQFINIADQHSLKGNYFNSVVEDNNGYIWISTKNHGLFRWDGDIFKQYKADTSRSGFDHIHSLSVDIDRRLWIASDQGVFKYDHSLDNIFSDTIFRFEDTITCYNIWDIYFTENVVYLGSDCGVYLFDYDRQMLEHILIPEFFKGHGHKEKRILSSHIDNTNSDILWIGTKYGLKNYNLKTKKLTTFPNPPKWHSTYSRNQQYAIYDITQASDQTLWLAACWSGGILHFNPSTDEWQQYLYPESVKEAPYYGNSLHSLTTLNDSLFFYSNNRGGGYFDLITNKMIPQKLPDYDYHTNHDSDHLIDRHGYVWIVGIEGVFKSSIPVKSEIESFEVAPVIKTISFGGKSSPTYSNIPIKILSDSSALSIDIGINNSLSSDHSIYRWKLDGYDSQWNENIGVPTIFYNQLKGGAYSFRYAVKSHPDEVFIEGNPFKFRVIQPFYTSKWFYSLAIIGLILLSFLVIQWRTLIIRRQERKKRAFDKKLAEIEMSALRAQMNPHFLFNTMNSINHYILKNDSDKASYYLTKFSRLVRQVLHNSKSKTVSLENEMESLRLYVELEQLRFDHRFEFDDHLDTSSPPDQINIPPMLIQPYIENAIWHGLLPVEDRTGKLKVTIVQNNNILIVTITDNGIGRKASIDQKTEYVKNKKSYGMQITKNRIKTINQIYNREARVVILDLIHNKMSHGTKVTLDIPIL